MMHGESTWEEFGAEDRVLVILQGGECYTTDFSDTQHFPRELDIVEKFDPNKVWTSIYYDAEQKYTYIKALPDRGQRKSTYKVEAENRIILLTDEVYPRFEVHFSEEDAHRLPIEIDGEEFIEVKSIRARGKRVSNYVVGEVEELEPTRFPEGTDVLEDNPPPQGGKKE